MGSAVIDAPNRYAAALSSDDSLTRVVAARQFQRLHLSSTRTTNRRAVSAWVHVPLADLFAEQGNQVHRRADRSLECGHEPLHGSNSGRCVLLDLGRGRWWCRSCRQSGDAPIYVMAVRGCGHRAAAAWLAERYGLPAGQPARRQPRRRRWLEA